MACAEKTLRSMIDHWLPIALTAQVRITRYRTRCRKKECYVRVETASSTGAIEIYFFRHPDGSWRVYPPNRGRPTMDAICFPEVSAFLARSSAEC
jgi:hypothetical protein